MYKRDYIGLLKRPILETSQVADDKFASMEQGSSSREFDREGIQVISVAREIYTKKPKHLTIINHV